MKTKILKLKKYTSIQSNICSFMNFVRFRQIQGRCSGKFNKISCKDVFRRTIILNMHGGLIWCNYIICQSVATKSKASSS
jgi:hypothetical protein